MRLRESGRTMTRRLIALLLTALVLVAVGCTLEQYPQSTLHPRSDFAQWIQDLLETPPQIIFIFYNQKSHKSWRER